MTPLHYAAQNGHFEVCKLIIENTEVKNPKGYFGWTPLHNAARNGHFEVSKLILDNIQDKNPNNSIGKS